MLGLWNSLLHFGFKCPLYFMNDFTGQNGSSESRKNEKTIICCIDGKKRCVCTTFLIAFVAEDTFWKKGKV